MTGDEFFDQLYALNRVGRHQELIAFAETHFAEVEPHLTIQDRTRLEGLIEAASKTLGFEEAAESDALIWRTS